MNTIAGYGQATAFVNRFKTKDNGPGSNFVFFLHFDELAAGQGEIVFAIPAEGLSFTVSRHFLNLSYHCERQPTLQAHFKNLHP